MPSNDIAALIDALVSAGAAVRPLGLPMLIPDAQTRFEDVREKLVAAGVIKPDSAFVPARPRDAPYTLYSYYVGAGGLLVVEFPSGEAAADSLLGQGRPLQQFAMFSAPKSPQHRYLAGCLVVRYEGSDAVVLDVLTRELGEPLPDD